MGFAMALPYGSSFLSFLHLLVLGGGLILAPSILMIVLILDDSRNRQKNRRKPND